MSTKHLKLEARPRKLQPPQYVGLFKVLQIIRHKATNSELPPAMKVHPVFNLALLKKN